MTNGTNYARRMESAYPGVEKPTLPRILLAEDDREMRRLLAAALEQDQYAVTVARNGVELQRRIDESLSPTRVDGGVELIISDIRMPGVDGLQILRRLRELDWSVPMILITAFGDRETHEEALRLGAIAVFDKPFDLDDLRTVVWNVVPGTRDR